MRLALGLAAVTIVIGCDSPREGCIRQAESAVRLLDQQIAESEAALGRGFRITEAIESRTTLHICAWPREPVLFCTRHTPAQPAMRVMVERETEEARLAQLWAERSQQAVVAADRIAVCPAI